MFGLETWIESPLAIAVAVFGLLAMWHRAPALSPRTRRMWACVCLAAIASFAVRAVGLARNRFEVHTEWDFLGFWMHGRAAWLGLDFYDNAALRSLDLPWEPSQEFAAELLVAGSVYPPFTSFLFAPFGAFEYETAYWVWCAFNAAMLALAVALAGRWLLRERAHGWLLAGALVALLRATLYTVHVQQSSALMLLCLVIAAAASARAPAGVALALAAAVKPLAAPFALAPLARREWRTIAAAAATGAALVAGSAAIWGVDRYASFVARPPNDSLPVSATVQPISQALVSEMSRRFGWHEQGRRPEREPAFLIVAAAITAATFVALGGGRRRRGEPRDPARRSLESEVALGAAVAFALVVYPGTKQHYGLVLVQPAIALWRAREHLPIPRAPDLVAGFIALAWAGIAAGFGVNAWAVFLSFWVAMIAAALALRVAPEEAPDDGAAARA